MSVFFFFKQKTAYEMRISDWSSDVCSSDLACGKQLRDRGAGQPAINDHGDTGWDKERGFGTGGDQTDGEPLRVPVLAQLRIHNATDRRHGGGSRARHRAEHQDRKSDVEGKRVSVRVDLGGRGIMQNKKNKQKKKRKKK